MRKQVLIAGAGIGGLSAALAAARAGCDVRLYEKTPILSEVGAGIQLGPNVLRHLHAWGLQSALEAVVAYPAQLQVRCALTGQELAVLPLGASTVQRYGAAYATIHRADLQNLLFENARQRADIDLHLGLGIEHHAETAHTVLVRTSAGREVEGDALIGADGLWSRTRSQWLDDGPPQATGHLAYRALAHQASLPKGLRTTQVTAWLGPRLHAVQYPVRRGELQNLVVIVHGSVPAERNSWDYRANAADLAYALQGTCSTLQDTMAAVPQAGKGWRLWPLLDRPPVTSAAHMAQGLIALLGDAAHPMRPYLAQGAGMAIEDAAQLQHALAMNELEMPLRLRRYALNRWARNAKVQARSARNGRIFHATGAMRWARDSALRLLGARLLDQPWLYRGGYV